MRTVKVEIARLPEHVAPPDVPLPEMRRARRIALIRAYRNREDAHDGAVYVQLEP